MMEQDLIEAKKYLSQQGYGSGTNYTTNLVALLLANYTQEQVKKFRLPADAGRSEQLCQHPFNKVVKNNNGMNYCSKCDKAI